ncbi:MAG: T9SS type A sorting domain-containing protein, partial [Aestuariibaculum sp.]
SFIGRRHWYTTFDGLIDEVRIYSKSLTAEEIRTSMHKVNDYDDPYLEHYFQFNEGAESLDSSGQITGGPQSGAKFVSSTAPVGNAHFATATQAVSTNLSAANVALTFASDDSSTNITAHQINRNPNDFTTGIDAALIRVADNIYWEVHRYGQTELGAQQLTFTVADAITADEAADPSIFKLYNRTIGDDTAWTLVNQATNVDTGTGKITFETVNATGQFIMFKDITTLSLNEIADTDFMVYPNPVSSILMVSNKTFYNTDTIDVYNTLGQIIATQKVNSAQTEINVSQLDSGIYILRYNSQQGQNKSIRFIKE